MRDMPAISGERVWSSPGWYIAKGMLVRVQLVSLHSHLLLGSTAAGERSFLVVFGTRFLTDSLS